MSVYLNRYASPALSIKSAPDSSTGLIIVIPVFNETGTLGALNSLLQSSLPSVYVEVLIIINQPIDCSSAINQQNKNTFEEVQIWIKLNSKKGISFYVQHINLPKKHAGVGLARKAGMDEAVRRFEQINNDKGIILCYDADCTCSPNYIKEVYDSFNREKLKGASIYYEHDFKQLTNNEKEGIIQYELHLRYYVNGLRKAGYPYAFHTVGSSMAVRCDIYKKAGGMNKRKAGEDFHFLHKVIPYGSFNEINTTSVLPSARTSDRVPFGTGKAMGNWMTNDNKTLFSYHPQIFKDIGGLLKLIPQFYDNENINKVINPLPSSVLTYLKNENFEQVIKDINNQSKTIKTFIHRWYGWMNGLRMLHLVHYLRDYHYPSKPIIEAAAIIINRASTNALDLLVLYRKLDREFIADEISLKHLYFEYL